jgi:hypothetical protein
MTTHLSELCTCALFDIIVSFHTVSLMGQPVMARELFCGMRI